MSKEQKAYAVTVAVKPQNQGSVKYKSVSSKGIVLATSPTKAKELVIEKTLYHRKDFDGSSFNKPLINRESISIKKCELFGDFIFKEE